LSPVQASRLYYDIDMLLCAPSGELALKFLLLPIGSHGDVHPYAALGRELARRGHHVVVATNEVFRPLIERLGLHFVQQGTAKEYREILQSSAIWHRTQGPPWLFKMLVDKPLQDVYRIVSAHRDAVVVAPAMAFAARIAQEKLGISLVTIHLAPSSLRSVTDPPILPGMPITAWMPLWMRSALFWLGDVLVIDRIAAGPINVFRKELGLPPVRRILDQWWNSPQRIIGMFPDWFARARDWPQQIRLTGFPLFDERDDHMLPADVAAFLEAGSPPVVFTPGSANAQAGAFFRAALDACERLRQRGLFLTLHEEQLPTPLPENIKHVRYAPFSQVVPRAAAFVHHGGIGTLSQGLAAGVPQLIMPLGFDQPDNAARVETLGVARSLSPSHFTGANVAQKLSELLTAAVRQRCQEIAGRFVDNPSVRLTCDLLEEAGRQASSMARNLAANG